ncbi:MAG: electron transport complex subunit RsxE [Candidatus Raymondbacteria bacterium RifOxyA12_full_50_37]|uniref:Ion-translocating oxidoreductase complex subunit E n=1 Tax=Candidatus Raymondbacteria bacterium RIFOXYD12_FULL_49_13 TaxID=1817890 RepID=A0A1F7F1A4_UNCRA|nr:MAG: electron transport complex subunit RsxE [Candidatus Raymondbacteria bacterium RifOxyA12_full_50_37]OGJ93131.1 MAG: electron transport complex subunit RsxE [Candidatus Raymondbacteria bacterium RifOxyB12_full_50_8]OGJ93919.1 MAG: electron transport complex subunit RsxE [Candidatus Raymondbacteria bacterium RIFOXYA2_FULL_49_16]OGJ98212.1 MAG: electron transport complex subunit RsxE [Candidatus Raymondbacteria bacterium RIFOXYC2_FULL_50_21]OGK00445.1 MAG: electron transport complex subunit
MSRIRTLTNGIVRENPLFVIVLGLCPSLAVTTSAQNALGMGLAFTFVLLGSNIVIASIKNAIPNQIRIPCFITVIATFVTIVDLVMKGYFYELYKSLGIFIPLIVVNCIVLARAEAFASKKSIFDSLLDAIGMGIGFTLAILIIGSIREILGDGSIFGFKIFKNFSPALIFILPPGAFITLGFIVAFFTKYLKKK